MNENLILILFSLLLFSCQKKTNCSGTLYYTTGQAIPDRPIYMSESVSNRFNSSKNIVATTNSAGFYQFSFNAKKNKVYALGCDSCYESIILINGENNKFDLFIYK
ncbi:MAG: hypothetical protein IPM51_03160 [Sphingobacteriaceae bacterium]|nr:hypothetical protein [Sphingobacteriaceae bacterium]